MLPLLQGVIIVMLTNHWLMCADSVCNAAPMLHEQQFEKMPSPGITCLGGGDGLRFPWLGVV